jgi:hypothetical protein
MSGVRLGNLPDLGALADGSVLAGATGAGGVGKYTASRLLTYVYSPNRAAASVMAYGAVGDGVADDTAALQAALTDQLCIYLPPGTYKTTAALTLRAGQTIIGAGRGAVVKPSTASQTTFSMTAGALTIGNLNLANFTIQAAAANVTGIGAALISDITVRDVQFLGCLYNVNIDQGYHHLVEGCAARPSGAFKAGQYRFASSSDSAYCFWPTLRDCKTHTEDEMGSTVGSQNPCVYLRRCVGGQVDGFVASRLQAPTPNTVTAILIENDCQGCKVINGLSHGASVGVLFQPGSGVAVAPGYCTVVNHDVDFFSTAGVFVAGSASASSSDIIIRGCQITAPQGASVPCVSVSRCFRPMVLGNVLDQYGATAGDGVVFSDVNGGVISENTINKMSLGIFFDSALHPVVNTLVQANSVLSCTTAISGDLTGAGTGTNRLRNNLGLNPQGITVTTPAVPASDAYITNTTGVDCLVYCYGGNGVTIGINGITTGVLFSPAGGEPKGGNAFLPAGASIGLHYGSAPTWVWIAT